ncbi:MAG: T9SS type A sorting domain-containing protein, partial [Ignavibacteria bacterium]
GHGAQALDSVGIEVRDFSIVQTGEMVAYYPFDGNANDSSGFNNNGTVNGAGPANDRNGSPGRAYSFNGTTNSVQVADSASLNFQQAVTINFWMKIGALFSREQYPISHGNWQNRWKVSISNNRLRWTVKTSAGTKDLDSETGLTIGTWYNITVLYSGSDYEIYLNGDLDAFSSWSGPILTTTIDLTIGQVLPTDQGYNFQGILDDVRIYNHALSVAQIQGLASGVSVVEELHSEALPHEYSLSQNYPDPFNPATQIRFTVPPPSEGSGGLRDLNRVTLKVYDVTGREITTLLDGDRSPGTYMITWDASRQSSGVYFVQLSAPAFQLTRKVLLLR